MDNPLDPITRTTISLKTSELKDLQKLASKERKTLSALLVGATLGDSSLRQTITEEANFLVSGKIAGLDKLVSITNNFLAQDPGHKLIVMENSPLSVSDSFYTHDFQLIGVITGKDELVCLVGEFEKEDSGKVLEIRYREKDAELC